MLPFSIYSQTIRGKIYDGESVVKGIKVYNISKESLTYTDKHGDFSMPACVNDTLIFMSLFNNDKSVKLKPNDFKDVAIFELKKIVNELEEVVLKDSLSQSFDLNVYSENSGEQLSNDLKNNKHLYIPESKYSSGVNFGELAKLIGGLFKKKNKTKNQPISYINYRHLDSLFSKDDLFNFELLQDELQIPEEYMHLFLDYCENKKLNKTLISEENHVILLDSMFNFSKEFMEIFKKLKSSKDSLDLKN